MVIRKITCRLVKQSATRRDQTGAWNDLAKYKSCQVGWRWPRPSISQLGYVRETDQGNLVVNDDVEGGGFEIGNALFQKFIFELDDQPVDSVENAKKALGSLENRS